MPATLPPSHLPPNTAAIAGPLLATDPGGLPGPSFRHDPGGPPNRRPGGQSAHFIAATVARQIAATWSDPDRR